MILLWMSVIHARSRIPAGESKANCVECDNEIPKARQRALPGVETCVMCQSELDRRSIAFSSYNRKGSKDSQLK